MTQSDPAAPLETWMSTRKVMSGGRVAASEWPQPDDGAGRVAANAVVPLKRAELMSDIDNFVEWFEDASYGVSRDHRCSDGLPEARHDGGIARGRWGTRCVVRRVVTGPGGVGHFGDWQGWRAALSLPILVKSCSTFLIALLPTYAQVGMPPRFAAGACCTGFGSRETSRLPLADD